MHYDVTIITVRPGTERNALARLKQTLPSLVGDELLACWYSDLGALSRILLLRAASNIARIHADREKIVRTENPFDVGEYIAGMSMDTACRRPSSCGASGCRAAQNYRGCSVPCIRLPAR